MINCGFKIGKGAKIFLPDRELIDVCGDQMIHLGVIEIAKNFFDGVPSALHLFDVPFLDQPMAFAQKRLLERAQLDVVFNLSTELIEMFDQGFVAGSGFAEEFIQIVQILRG